MTRNPFLLALPLLALATSAPLPAVANGFKLEPPKVPANGELLPKTPIASLQVEPAQLDLRGRYAGAQLLVTAQLADGTVADVTRLVTITVPGGEVKITPNGQVSPVRDGRGTLQVQAGGKSVSIPVAVAEFGAEPKPDFIRDINPVLTKLGCNMGTCHGAKDGKAGFKLSLRGYDPLFDIRGLKDDLAGRRLNVAQPDDSLMLLKATAGVPHEGGQRTKIGDRYYDMLRQWIAQGGQLDLKSPKVVSISVRPLNPVVQQIGSLQQTRIVAKYADGRERDVTAEAFIESGNTDVATTDGDGLIRTLRRGEAPILARYEGNYAATTITVMGERDGFTWQQPETWGRIDELVASKWQRMKIQPSGLCSDTDFLRRVYLDLTGLPPAADDVRAFLADSRPTREKRAAIVDKLIGSPDFVDYWTNKWSDLLAVNSKFLAREGAENFRKWIRDEVNKNTPYDEFVRKLITAQGSTKENPAANYWKILRTPEELVENTTHLFLATRFNCNKCHDHPFERWTQDQYYELGSFFSRVQRDRDPASGTRVIAGSAVESAVPLWEKIADAKAGEMVHLRTNAPAKAQFPYAAKLVTLKRPAPAAAPQPALPPKPVLTVAPAVPTVRFAVAPSTLGNASATVLARTLSTAVKPVAAQFVAAKAPAAPVAKPAEPLPLSRREELAAWLTSPDNRYFAMSYANRIWGYLTGVGVIEPLDDIRAGNPPSNPELLDYLTKEFISSKFDVRHLMRLVCNSRTYQLELAANQWNEDDKTNYSHAQPRRLPAEVLYDSVVKVTGSSPNLPGVAPGTRAAQLPDSAIDLPSGFLAVLGRPARETSCECERSSEMRLGGVMSLLAGPAVAEAIGDPKSSLAHLVNSTPDDRKLVDEVFLRVLNRPARETEIVKALESWGRIDAEHQTLDERWKAKEAEQAPIIARMEQERTDAIAKAKAELTRYEGEIAPRVAEAEKQRLASVAAQENALKEYEAKQMAAAQSAWEGTLTLQRLYTAWQPVAASEFRTLNATGNSKLETEPDGTIVNRVTPTGFADYNVQFNSKTAGITGILLEVLPSAELPGFGPGSEGGNFVVTEFSLDWVAPGKGSESVPFKAAQADFSQKDYPVANAINNKRENGTDGWAIAPQVGRPHLAAFTLSKPVGDAKGSIITLRVTQRRSTALLQRFRIWYTTSPTVNLGYPADALEALKVPPATRTPAQKAALTKYFRGNEADVLKRDLTLAKTRLPLPTDVGVLERRTAITKAEEPITLDPQLVQLRQDVEQSRTQSAQLRRLTGAQDLVWALINNPAFLFNH